MAKTTQLMLEYDPAPPLASGHPRTGDPANVAVVEGLVGEAVETAIDMARELVAARV